MSSSSKRSLILGGLFILSVLLSVSADAQTVSADQKSVQDIVPEETVERLKDIFESREFAVKSYRAEWHPDGSSYLRLETPDGDSDHVLASYDAASGKRQVILSTSQISSENNGERSRIESYLFSPDRSRILFAITEQKDGERSLSHWIYELSSSQLIKVMAGRNSSISPDSKRILFSDKGNISVYDIESGKITVLRSDAEAGSLMYNHFEWSPDGTKVAFVQSDASSVRIRSMLIPGDPSYPEVRESRFARIGGEIAKLRVGVVDAEGKETQWLPIPIPAEGYYLGQVSWAANSNELLVEKLSRFRDKREFILADIESGKIKRIFSESDPAWVVASYRTNIGLDWINDYKNFLILSEKEGWRQAWLCSRDGSKQQAVTPAYDIIGKAGLDKDGGWFFYNASPDNGTQSYLYRASLKKAGRTERLTPDDQPGSHTYNVSPCSNWAIHTWSSANKPPLTELISLPDHKTVRIFEDNKELAALSSSFQPKEFFSVDIGGGVEIDGWMIKPHDFDPSKKYPVFIYVYGEPHSQTVRDSWGNAMADYHRVIADLGYIVISMDNRGTPCPKGAAWRRVIAGKLGPLSTKEQAEALKGFGSSRPWADLDRVGIWGWSGGGSNTLNALFRRPDVYHLGIAVVPKPRPELYNAWFQEIYMNTPEVNPEGYKVSAPINYAEGLRGNLLIVTGTGETNTHVQIVESLVDRLIELGKQFDYIAYPNRNHGISEGEGTSLHLRVYMSRYLLTNLPAGPREQ